VIAEHEKAKIAERHRRGKLFRARAGEITTWKAPYGDCRIPCGAPGPAHLEIYEPKAAIGRRIFTDRACVSCSVRSAKASSGGRKPSSVEGRWPQLVDQMTQADDLRADQVRGLVYR
jgi:hypothetical protein